MPVKAILQKKPFTWKEVLCEMSVNELKNIFRLVVPLANRLASLWLADWPANLQIDKIYLDGEKATIHIVPLETVPRYMSMLPQLT